MSAAEFREWVARIGLNATQMEGRTGIPWKAFVRWYWKGVPASIAALVRLKLQTIEAQIGSERAREEGR